MKLSVYVPKDLEEPLRRQAAVANLTPSRLIQSLLEEELRRTPNCFSEAFLALAGTWEERRSTDEILREIETSRRDSHRPALR